MDVRALFDKLLTDLGDAGVQEARDESGARLLVRDGVPFARLGHDERMAFRSLGGGAEGAAGGPDALQEHAGELVTAQRTGEWIVVPADDVSEWEALARKALAAASS